MLVQHSHGVVLAHLEFVTDHREFLVEILFLDEGIHHAVRFQVERPLQVLVGGFKCFEVIGAIEAGASSRTIGDVLAIATRSVIVSHTGVKGTCDNSPNLSDAELRGIAHTGGVALGSDFDGAVVVPFDTTGLGVLIDALFQAGFSEDDIAKIMGGNALRVLLASL